MGRTAEKRFVRHVCVRNPFPPFLLAVRSIQSLPEAWGSWERKYVPPAPRYGCIMPIPPLQLQKKTCFTQRSRGFGRGVVVSKICYNTVIVLSVVLCDCCKHMNNCRDWVFCNSGSEVGCQPFSCRCTPTVTYCRKEICSTCWIKESIPAIPLRTSKHALPARSRFLRAAAPSTSSALWLHHAQPFVAAVGKRPVACREEDWVLSRSCGLQDLLQRSDCALSCAMWLLQTNAKLLRLSF